MKKATKDDYINQISDIFYEAVEKDLAPWSKPWKAEDFKYNSHNPMSKSAYKGNNALLLETLKLTKGYNSNAWLTFNQIKELGGNIEKGSKSAPVVFYSKLKKTDEELAKDGKNEYKFILKKYSVFNLDQVKGLSEEKLSKLKSDEEELAKNEFLTINECEEILNKADVKILNSPQSRAFYMPEQDEIHLPLKEQFSSLEAYYSVAFHELGHSTGHKDRLDRDLSGKFGTEKYAKEELRAEIYSFLQAKELGIDYNLENHQSYVKSWTKEFKDKREEIYEAVKDSLKMVEYVRENYIEKALELKADSKEDSLLDKVVDYAKDEAKDELKDKVKELNPKVFDELNESLAAFVGIESNPIKKTKDILFQA